MGRYNGELLFNGILPLDIEVMILKYNNLEYDYENEKITNKLMDEVKGRIPKYYNSSIQYWAPNELPNKLLRELSYLKKERCIFYSYHVLLKTFEIGTVRLIHLGINETKHVVVYPDTRKEQMDLLRDYKRTHPEFKFPINCRDKKRIIRFIMNA